MWNPMDGWAAAWLFGMAATGRLVSPKGAKFRKRGKEGSMGGRKKGIKSKEHKTSRFMDSPFHHPWLGQLRFPSQ